MGEAGLAHHPLGHQPASQADRAAGLTFGGQVLIFSLQICRKGVTLIMGQCERIMAGGLQVRQLAAADSLLGRRIDGGGFVWHESSSFLCYLLRLTARIL